MSLIKLGIEFLRISFSEFKKEVLISFLRNKIPLVRASEIMDKNNFSMKTVVETNRDLPGVFFAE